MSDFVKEDNVFVNQDAESREAVLRFIADRAAELGITDDADAVYEAFLAREDMGETGMTDGFAVPHAKTDAINNAMSFFIFDSLHFMIIFSNIRMPRSLGDDLSVQKKCKVRIVYFVKSV